MKKSILIILIVVFGGNFVFAQRLSARLDVGGSKRTYSNLNPHHNDFFITPKHSFNLGIGVKMPIRNFCEFSSDLLFTNINSHVQGNGVISDTSYHMFLELPNGPFSELSKEHYYFWSLQSYFSFGTKPVKLFFGGRLAMLSFFHGKYVLNYVGGGWESKTELDKERRKDFDYGYIAGCNINLSPKIDMIFTYYHGLQDLTHKLPAPRLNAYQYNYQLTMGISYLLKDYEKQKMRTKEKLT